MGVQAQGRTTILKINYCNTKQILQTASLIAADDMDDDGIALLKPISCSRDGAPPTIIHLPNLREEGCKISELLATAHDTEGLAWNDMAILCRDHATMDACAHALRQRDLPHQVRHRSGDYRPERHRITASPHHRDVHARQQRPGVSAGGDTGCRADARRWSGRA